MIIERNLQPNCSEAVFRFYTLDPKQIHFILQAVADEVSCNCGIWGKQTIPEFKTADEYETGYNPHSEKDYKEFIKKQRKIRAGFQKGEITKEECDKLLKQEYESYDKKKYPKGALLYAIAGFGDNECVITTEKDKGAFRLNIGNNDISENNTSWIEKVESLGILVEEAKYSKELAEHSRDCTCGITYFDGYENLVTDENRKRFKKQLKKAV